MAFKFLYQRSQFIKLCLLSVSRFRTTGLGIPEDKLDKIFEKFTQADNTITRKYGGTGLGLTITKTLSELMGGSISVSSKVGIGSTFTVVLPLHEVAASSNMNVENENKSFLSETGYHKGKVLLVEDYEPNVLVASAYLTKFGYSYDVAPNGMAALNKAKTNTYSAILMDVQMPEMNGFEVTRALREFEEKEGKERTAIIGMTAHALNGDKERCLASGMDDYISKPFSPNDLQKKLENTAIVPS